VTGHAGDGHRRGAGWHTRSVQVRRRILGVLAGAIVIVTVAYLAVREPGGAADDVRSSGDTSTTRATASTTTSVASTTTTAPSTTAARASATTTTTTVRAVAVSPTTAPAPPFQSSVEGVTAEQLGASWTPGIGCTPPEQLRALVVSHWGYDGQVHTGRLIVSAAHAERIVAVLRDVYAARFPIQRMVPIDQYGGDDQASMRANNTSGYNCRTVAGSTKLSEHAVGQAIDVNPLVNPYVKGSTVDPPEGARYADRRRTDQGMIHAGDAVVAAFAKQGWAWGGYWSSGKDYQHFSSSGR
jgi:hypothetical protein